MPVVLLLIGIRVVYIQVLIRDRFLTPWKQTDTIARDIPARNGRILTRDGAVLAYDETRYDVAIDYRRIESPPDPLWLRREVYSRLSPKNRRDPTRRAVVERELLAEQQSLFSELSSLSGISVELLRQRSVKIQQRIERMVTAVEARRKQRDLASTPRQLQWSEGMTGVLTTIKSELTTPPRRRLDDPIILKEELEPHVVITDVPLNVVAAIESTPHRFPGVHVLHRSIRVYPHEDLSSHLIGVRKTRTANGEVAGEGGVEEAFDNSLRGRTGRHVDNVNRRGEVVDSQIEQPARDGDDIVMTIDSRLQRTAERLLDRAIENRSPDDADPTPPVGGVVIVMDLWTGDLLTAASAPRVSLTTLMHPTQEEWQEIIAQANHPLFPRALQMAVPPGSVFKVITAAAAFETGLIDQQTSFHCQGYLHNPQQLRCQLFRQSGKGHGDLFIDDAFCQSCNVFFFDLAEKMPTAQLNDWAVRFGFGAPTGIELPGESSGELPKIGQSSASGRLARQQALQMSIGQGDLLATPLQVTRMMAAIGNGGYLVTPRIVTHRSESEEMEQASQLKKIPGLSQDALMTIRRGLEMVVHHPLGTGTSAMTSAMTVAGKTGTAQTGSQPDHAWFAGFVPVDSPRMAFVVLLEHGGSGGEVAAPIAAELVTEMMGLGYLRPRWDETETSLIAPNKQTNLTHTTSPITD